MTPSTHASLSGLMDTFRDLGFGPARPRGLDRMGVVGPSVTVEKDETESLRCSGGESGSSNAGPGVWKFGFLNEGRSSSVPVRRLLLRTERAEEGRRISNAEPGRATGVFLPLPGEGVSLPGDV